MPSDSSDAGSILAITLIPTGRLIKHQFRIAKRSFFKHILRECSLHFQTMELDKQERFDTMAAMVPHPRYPHPHPRQYPQPPPMQPQQPQQQQQMLNPVTMMCQMSQTNTAEQCASFLLTLKHRSVSPELVEGTSSILAEKMLATEHPLHLDFVSPPRDPGIPMAMPDDKYWLSDLHCFLRSKCCEFFLADENDSSTLSKKQKVSTRSPSLLVTRSQCIVLSSHSQCISPCVFFHFQTSRCRIGGIHIIRIRPTRRPRPLILILVGPRIKRPTRSHCRRTGRYPMRILPRWSQQGGTGHFLPVPSVEHLRFRRYDPVPSLCRLSLYARERPSNPGRHQGFQGKWIDSRQPGTAAVLDGIGTENGPR